MWHDGSVNTLSDFTKTWSLFLNLWPWHHSSIPHLLFVFTVISPVCFQDSFHKFNPNCHNWSACCIFHCLICWINSMVNLSSCLKFDPWVGKIPWRRKCQPTPVFLSGKSLGQRNLAGYSSCGCRVRHDWATEPFLFCFHSDFMYTQHVHTHRHTQIYFSWALGSSYKSNSV